MLTLNNLDVVSSPLPPSKYLHILKDQQFLLEILSDYFLTLGPHQNVTRILGGEAGNPNPGLPMEMVLYSAQVLILLQISSDDSNVKSGLKVVFRDAHRLHFRPPESETWYVAQWSVFSHAVSPGDSDTHWVLKSLLFYFLSYLETSMFLLSFQLLHLPLRKCSMFINKMAQI